MSDALGTGGAPSPVSAADHRLALAGLIAAAGPGMAARTGILMAPGATALLTGTSATGTMTVNIAAHHWVTSRADADGVYIGAKEATSTVNIAAAPGSNSRIDLVYAKQNDTAVSTSVSPDGTQGPEYGVVTGTPAVTPVKPALPVGAIELGTVTVAAGATATNGAGVTIANSGPLTTVRGGLLPVRTQTERLALATYQTLQVLELDNGRRLHHDGTRWRYEGDHVIVSTNTQRDALNPLYDGLQVTTTSTKRRWQRDGSRWLLVGGVAPAVTVRRTTAVGLATNVWSALGWESQVADETTDTSMWSSGQSTRLVAPIDGSYLFEGSMGFSAAAGERYLAARKNGGAASGWHRMAFQSLADSRSIEMPFITTMRLAAGQYVELLYNTSAAVNCPAYSEIQPRAELRWIGNY